MIKNVIDIIVNFPEISIYLSSRWTWLTRLRLDSKTLSDLLQPPPRELQLWHFHTTRWTENENWGRLTRFSVYKYSAINRNIKQDLLAYDPLFFVGEPCAKDRPHGSSVTWRGGHHHHHLHFDHHNEVASVIIIIDIMINLRRWSSHSLSSPSSIIYLQCRFYMHVITNLLICPPYMYYICIWPVTRWLRRWPLLWQLIGFQHSSYLPGCCLNLHNLNLLILNVNIKGGRVELYSPRWKILGGARQKGYQKRSLHITVHSKQSAGEKWSRE